MVSVIRIEISPNEIENTRQKITSGVEEGLRRAGAFLVSVIQDNLSGPSPATKGDFPGSSSGELAKSIAFRVENSKLTVIASAPHAATLEFGDHPFMARSLRENESRVVAIVVQAIQEALR